MAATRVRAAWRLVRATVHALHGAAIVALRFPRFDAPERQRRIAWWSAKLLRLLGIRLVTQGAPAPGPVMVVANHVSWLDIAAIHASAPHARFVSKADVLAWPVLGRMVRDVGTLFIERERKRDALRVVHQMAEALARGETVAVFPEGTTSSGHGVLPFHANLLQAAVSTGTPVQPVVLRFSDPRHLVSPAAEFIGETTLVQSLWAIAAADGLRVRVAWLPVRETRGADRRQLALGLQQTIGTQLAAPGAQAG